MCGVLTIGITVIDIIAENTVWQDNYNILQIILNNKTEESNQDYGRIIQPRITRLQ